MEGADQVVNLCIVLGRISSGMAANLSLEDTPTKTWA